LFCQGIMHSHILVSPAGRVMLHLPGKSYKPDRCIGWFDEVDTFHCERTDNAIFKGFGGSIGFNVDLMKCRYDLRKHKRFNRVVVHLISRGARIETTRLYILAHGRFLHFRHNMLEKQIFLSLRDFGREKGTTTGTTCTGAASPN